MNVGDRVRLLRQIGPCPPDSEGVVIQVLSNSGAAIVEVDKRADCTPWTPPFELPPSVPSDFGAPNC